MLKALGQKINSAVKLLISNKSSNSIKKDENLIVLSHLPSLFEINSLMPEIIIFDLYQATDKELKNYSKLVKQIRKYDYWEQPVFGITQAKSKMDIPFLEDLDGIIELKDRGESSFQNAYKQMYLRLEQIRKNRSLFQSLSKINKQVSTIRSLNQEETEPVFHYPQGETNLDFAYRYVYKNNLPGTFFQIINLSVSHQGILFVEINDTESIRGLMIGHLQGIINLLNENKSPLLQSPEELIEYIAESLTNYGLIEKLNISIWYGVLDLSQNTIKYSGSNNIKPLVISRDILDKANILNSEESEIKLEPNSRILFYDQKIAKDKGYLEIIKELFTEYSQQSNNLKEIPNQIVSHLFDEHLDMVRSSNLSEGSLFLVCELPYSESFSSEIKLDNTEDLSQKACEEIFIDTDRLAENIKTSFEELFQTAYNLTKQWEDLNEKPKSKTKLSLQAWRKDNHIDLSLRMKGNSLPWAFDYSDLESIAPLSLYFDEINTSPDGYEISMRKSLN